MEFTNLQTELPPANVLVLIHRTKGPLYFGYRNDKPISENIDASRDCHWYGRPVNETDVNRQDSFFNRNFSDVTVTGWCHVGPVFENAQIEVL